MKYTINNKVITPYGKGIIKHIEEIYKKNRYGIDLDENPFNYTPVYFWENEIKNIVT